MNAFYNCFWLGFYAGLIIFTAITTIAMLILIIAKLYQLYARSTHRRYLPRLPARICGYQAHSHGGRLDRLHRLSEQHQTAQALGWIETPKEGAD